MKAEFQMPDPSVDWRAVARMIEGRHDLREDVTMVVAADRLRFVDEDQREIHSLPPGQWTNSTIADLDTTLSLLDWIEEQFSQRAS